MTTIETVVKIRRSTDAFKERLHWGWRRLIAFYFFTLLERWLGLHVYRLWVGGGMVTTWHEQLPKKVPDEYPTRRLEPQDLIPYACEENKLTLAFLTDAQARGDSATVVFHEDSIVSYAFRSDSRTPFEHGLELLIPPGFSYAYKSWTHPDHRRRGLTKYRSKVDWDYQRVNGGPRRGVWYIKFHNYPSLLTDVYEPPHQRPIYVGLLFVLKIFKRTVYFNSRHVKWFGSVLVRCGEPAYRTYPYT